MPLDSILGHAANGDFAHYRPGNIGNAVNALLPLGKDGALAAIESYLAKCDLERDPQEGLFLVLRVLFEVPADPGYQPPLRLGGSSPPAPVALQSMPLFPLVLVDDRPLMVVSGYALGGDVEPVSVHLRHFRATGTLRRKALSPSQSPSEVLAQFEALYQAAYGSRPSQHERAFVEAQVE